MKERVFKDLLQERLDSGRSLCVGLDPVVDKMSKSIQGLGIMAALVRFCCSIVDETSEYVATFKPNIAFFERYGGSGMDALKRIIAHIHATVPEVPVIVDAKRGDIGNTNLAYIWGLFDTMRADAVTLHPYLGREAMQPFLDLKNKGCIFLAKTSNPGAGEFQDLVQPSGLPLWLHIAKAVETEWNTNNNCGLVLGATYDQDIKLARDVIGYEIPCLVPGLGTQEGDLKATVIAAGKNATFNVARDIIFAESPGERARWYSEQLRTARRDDALYKKPF